MLEQLKDAVIVLIIFITIYGAAFFGASYGITKFFENADNIIIVRDIEEIYE